MKTARSGTKRHKTKALTAAKAGLPPGSLVHVGTVKTDRPQISLIAYDDGGIEEKRFGSIAESREYVPARGRLWLNVHGLQDAAILGEIGRRFRLHPLVLEDILNTHQRAKIEDYGDYLFCVLRVFAYDAESRTLSSDQLSIVLGENFILTFQERRAGLFEPVRERMRAAGSPLLKHGTDYLAYTLLDTVIDQYFVVVDQLGDTAEQLEDEALASPTPALLRMINLVKHDTQLLRRAIWPLREVLNGLLRGESRFFQPETRLYLRDIYDHTIHVIETLDAVRELLGDLMDMYLSSVSNRLNVEVRILTVLTTLFLPATLITGIFGMNFSHMPLLGDAQGFYIALAMMAGVAGAMAAAFWRRNWLRL
ncbi:magnesium/cobalt transporter CorA [Aromatoleum toluvorans]|uniref:Magnesium transport protein CorA n=1 Tax=Aromatoleum toluvorans TaxID=92002 RepID=A0ABX1Q0N9_9RHOO|nr:magnesium/cobalt transporter CorA [Aromatoleum toluvorans]NMG45259.1 magnesium/cobalt transporter CorA [Aromatoleum toluvorans]